MAYLNELNILFGGWIESDESAPRSSYIEWNNRFSYATFCWDALSLQPHPKYIHIKIIIQYNLWLPKATFALSLHLLSVIYLMMPPLLRTNSENEILLNEKRSKKKIKRIGSNAYVQGGNEKK